MFRMSPAGVDARIRIVCVPAVAGIQTRVTSTVDPFVIVTFTTVLIGASVVALKSWNCAPVAVLVPAFVTTTLTLDGLLTIGGGSIGRNGSTARLRSGHVNTVRLRCRTLLSSSSSAIAPPAWGSGVREGSTTAEMIRVPSSVPVGVQVTAKGTELSAGTFCGPAVSMNAPTFT